HDGRREGRRHDPPGSKTLMGGVGGEAFRVSRQSYVSLIEWGGGHEPVRARQGDPGDAENRVAGDREPGDLTLLFANYVAPLAAIPAICGLIGWVAVGAPLGTGIAITLLRYVLSFVAGYLVPLDHRCALADPSTAPRVSTMR